MEQFIKDALQLGFSFFVAAYLLVVMTNLIRELREQFISMKEGLTTLTEEMRELRRDIRRQNGNNNPKMN